MRTECPQKETPTQVRPGKDWSTSMDGVVPKKFSGGIGFCLVDPGSLTAEAEALGSKFP
jgi:hypothetical protein